MAKVILVKDAYRFKIRQCVDHPDLRQAVFEVPINMESVMPYATEDSDIPIDQASADLCKLIKSIFVREDGRIVNRYLSITFQNTRGSRVEETKFRARLQGGLLQEIKQLSEDVQVSLEISDFSHEESLYSSSVSHKSSVRAEAHRMSSTNWSPSLSTVEEYPSSVTKEMDIIPSRVTSFCEDLITFPSCWVQSWCQYLDWEYWEYTATISVIIHQKEKLPGASRDDANGEVEEIVALNEAILRSQYLTDVELISGSGTVFRCHSLFLVAQSETFKAMIQPHNNQISMDGMSDEGVKAFLSYLYTRDKKTPTQNPMTALELLQASSRYNIATMEVAMHSILLSQPDSAFGMEVALQLFQFTSTMKKCKSLKKKAFQILKLKFQDMPMSAFLAKFRGNPAAAKELFEAFFEFQ